ncbi:MAG: hypothetical protein WDM89_13235 [Rhizomicrobium sp.]
MATTLDFAPYVPLGVLWAIVAIAAALTIYGFVRRARGAWARGLAFAALIFAIANPLLVHEKREPLSDVAVVVVDRSQSMGIENRTADANKALAEIKKRLAGEKDLEIRETTVTTQTTARTTAPSFLPHSILRSPMCRQSA